MFKKALMTMAVASMPMAQGWADTVEEKTAELKVGETQVLELRGNPTTGFRWMLAEALSAHRCNAYRQPLLHVAKRCGTVCRTHGSILFHTQSLLTHLFCYQDGKFPVGNYIN